MRRWWAENRHLSLREMQIEAFRWAIKRERQIGFPETDDKKHYIDPLVERLNKLTQGKSD